MTRQDRETHTERDAGIFERDHGPTYDDDRPDLSELEGLGGMPKPHRCDGCSVCVAVRVASDQAEALRRGTA